MHPTDEHDDTAPAMEMPRYVSHKKVWALEIAEVSLRNMAHQRKLSFRDVGYAPIVCEDDLFARYVPVPGDFYVVYADGYKSFSPRKAFLDGYTREPQVRQSRYPGLDGIEKLQAERKQRNDIT